MMDIYGKSNNELEIKQVEAGVEIARNNLHKAESRYEEVKSSYDESNTTVKENQKEEKRIKRKAKRLDTKVRCAINRTISREKKLRELQEEVDMAQGEHYQVCSEKIMVSASYQDAERLVRENWIHLQNVRDFQNVVIGKELAQARDELENASSKYESILMGVELAKSKLCIAEADAKEKEMMREQLEKMSQLIVLEKASIQTRTQSIKAKCEAAESEKELAIKEIQLWRDRLYTSKVGCRKCLRLIKSYQNAKKQRRIATKEAKRLAKEYCEVEESAKFICEKEKSMIQFGDQTCKACEEAKKYVENLKCESLHLDNMLSDAERYKRECEEIFTLKKEESERCKNIIREKTESYQDAIEQERGARFRLEELTQKEAAEKKRLENGEKRKTTCQKRADKAKEKERRLRQRAQTIQDKLKRAESVLSTGLSTRQARLMYLWAAERETEYKRSHYTNSSKRLKDLKKKFRTDNEKSVSVFLSSMQKCYFDETFKMEMELKLRGNKVDASRFQEMVKSDVVCMLVHWKGAQENGLRWLTIDVDNSDEDKTRDSAIMDRRLVLLAYPFLVHRHISERLSQLKNKASSEARESKDNAEAYQTAVVDELREEAESIEQMIRYYNNVSKTKDFNYLKISDTIFSEGNEWKNLFSSIQRFLSSYWFKGKNDLYKMYALEIEKKRKELSDDRDFQTYSIGRAMFALLNRQGETQCEKLFWDVFIEFIARIFAE